MQAQLEQLIAKQAEQEAKTTAEPGTTTTTTVTTNVAPKPNDEGGVWVNQYRTAQIANQTIKIDKMRQYYSKADFQRLTDVHPQDTEMKRTGFEVLGIQYEIEEDTRV